MWTEGGGRGEMNWEIGVDICTLPCVKQIASRNLLYGAGSSALCSVVTQRGEKGAWREEGPRRRFVSTQR